MAYQQGELGLHSECLIRFSKEKDGKTVSRLVKTTIGRVIFNRPIPQDLGFVDRTNPENEFELEVSFVVKKKQLGQIVDKCIRAHGIAIASKVLDEIKAQGYKYSTISGTTVAVIDALIPEKKKEYLAEAEAKVDEITNHYNFGEMTNDLYFRLQGRVNYSQLMFSLKAFMQSGLITFDSKISLNNVQNKVNLEDTKILKTIKERLISG